MSEATPEEAGQRRRSRSKRERKLLRRFGEDKGLLRALACDYDAETCRAIGEEVRRELEALAPEVPHFGPRMGFFNIMIEGASQILAVYRVLERRGRSCEEIGDIVYRHAEIGCGRVPGPLRSLAGRLWFGRFVTRYHRRQAAESEKREYPDNWVMSFVEGDGDFDWGVDYFECAVVKFFRAHGAEDFAPYVCRLDFAASEAFHWGLRRSTTIAEGHPSCDFRFRRGRALPRS
jgi:hypothetical protein